MMYILLFHRLRFYLDMKVSTSYEMEKFLLTTVGGINQHRKVTAHFVSPLSSLCWGGMMKECKRWTGKEREKGELFGAAENHVQIDVQVVCK